jgi:mannose-6-phosphate isomerase-like protein (cupin superfamily)
MSKITPDDMHFVEKVWGWERWICNNEKYCGKILHFFDGHHCSWHVHKLKEEHFYVSTGTIEITFGYDEDIAKAEKKILNTEDAFHVPIGLIHQMRGVGGDAEMFEFSTQHFDSDSYRILPGA